MVEEQRQFFNLEHVVFASTLVRFERPYFKKSASHKVLNHFLLIPVYVLSEENYQKDESSLECPLPLISTRKIYF